jgi:4-hydroxyphenylpyruvate dioxygenase
MRTCIATVSLSGSLPEKIKAAGAAGFDGVELFENDLLAFDGSPRDVRHMAADVGLAIDLYQPFRDFEGTPDDVFRRNLDRAERKFDVMQALGAPMLLVCSNVSPNAVDDEALAAAQLYKLASRAAKRGLRIGYEALAWGARVNRVGEAWRIVEKADHPHLGVVLDSFHILARGDDARAFAAIPAEKLAFIQLADAPKMSLDVLNWSRRFRNFPGQGDFDLAAFVKGALDIGYTGALSLEVFNDEFRAGSARATAEDGKRSLLLLEEQVRRLNGMTPTPATHPAVALFDPPAPPILDGISFIEFAVRASEADDLQAWLGQFGFVRTGRHRSKAVTLYEAGSVHLVLNAEPDSLAHSLYLLRGVSVCAIGVRVDDPHRAVSRAVSFGLQRFEGRVGPNELRIPAIRSPDAGLIYFVSGEQESAGLYDIEFDRVEAPKEGPTGVDHLAIALPNGQLDSTVLFYRAVMGLQGEATQSLNDPHGVVRSRVVADPGHTLRLAFNVSSFDRTETARSASMLAGGGVQQIAFACEDLVGFLQTLPGGRDAIIPIPDNYYDDLDSKSILDRARIDQLRALGILYDASDGGGFLHAYSHVYEGRFFFEFIQRVDGYDGYGEANTPLRLAAQSQLRKSASLSTYL